MAGYLDQYGAGDERRSKAIRKIVIAAVAVAALIVAAYVAFHNYRQERQARRFFELLAAHDYKGAYGLWGCTDAHPCRDYPESAFMQDWGPQASPIGDFQVLDGESCGSGVIVDVDAGKAGDKKLWVERDSLVLAFPPPGMESCPQRNRVADWLRSIRYRMHGRTFKP
jgi:hypothetical protein